ncbi:MAG: PQQ-binding-like beta-propeller repeat protein [Pirellulaceae bacterium]|nr:PQQ-binding-like beta-propeller repeat protein [Pirellulaceae bacterium]
MRGAFFSGCLCVAVLVAPSFADDWPQWLGPQRDSVWRETGIVDRFPEGGPKVRWRAPVGLGYSGPAVVAGRVFLMDYVKRTGTINNNPGSRDQLEGTERVLCLSAETGQVLWKHEYERPYNVSFGGGPRCTPTVAGGKVYALGGEGNLWCLDAETGQVLWSKDFVKDYGAATPFWGVAAHPLVDGDVLYCVVGGEGSVAVAFDRHTGREIWRALSAPAQGYCPPTMIEHAGRKQLLIWHSETVNSLNPLTGDVYWTVPVKPSYEMSITAPRKLGDFLFVTGYNEAGALLKLGQTDGKPSAEVVWRGTPRNAVYCANSTPFLEDGMIYGCDVGSGKLMGVRLETAERIWETWTPTLGEVTRGGRYATAFLVKHEDRFVLFNELGDLILAKLSPQGYEELDRANLLAPTNSVFGRALVWSHPALADRCVFARNDKELVCVSLAKE